MNKLRLICHEYAMSNPHVSNKQVMKKSWTSHEELMKMS